MDIGLQDSLSYVNEWTVVKLNIKEREFYNVNVFVYCLIKSSSKIM